MTRIPKFVSTDKVRLKGDTERIMSISKFKTIHSLSAKTPVYTGLILCYWLEGKQYKMDTFNEEDLERYLIG